MRSVHHRQELTASPLLPHDREAARAGQRLIMAALDHSQCVFIEAKDAGNASPVVLPPASLELIARLLEALSEGEWVSAVPAEAELSVTDAARYLNVSRSFVIREIEAGRLPYRKVGATRWIEFRDVVEYGKRMRANQEAALDQLAQDAHDLGLDA